MSTIETILSRAMQEPDFADLLFSDPEKALAGYDLSAEELARLGKISPADLITLPELALEERKSLASGGIGRLTSLDGGKTW